jgi:hypothetical protein
MNTNLPKNSYGHPITSNLDVVDVETQGGFLDRLADFVTAVNEPVVPSSVPHLVDHYQPIAQTK